MRTKWLSVLAVVMCLVLAAPVTAQGQAEDNAPATGMGEIVAAGSARAIATGAWHTCALTTGGGVKCWGWNDQGRLGDGTTTDRLTPVDVTGLNSGVAAVAAGDRHSCALTTSGGVKCWGDNSNGQLGDGTTTDRYTPTSVSGLSSGVAAIAAGDGHTCALTAGGGVKCWGENRGGQLGDGTMTQRLTPVNVSGLSGGVATIATSYNHTCALTTGGGVKCWGWNVDGRLGDGTTTQRLKPVDVSGLSSGVAAIAAGYYHTCAVTAGGGAKCWGYNLRGQLGDGTTTGRLRPVDVSGLHSGVAAVAVGDFHTCALTTGRDVKCWGANGFGVLGDGTETDRLTPVAVSGLSSGAAAIAAALVHTCALMTGGGIKCWGANGFGVLGDGTKTERHTPVDVVGFGGGGGDCVAPSGLDVCALQPGDILVKAGASKPGTPGFESYRLIFGIGGTYFTHAALYVGQISNPVDPGHTIPTIAEAAGYCDPPCPADEVRETLLRDTEWYTGHYIADWAVVRPSVGQTTKTSAIKYARDKAAEDGVGFQMVPMPGLDDEYNFYCSKLVWKAYEKAGANVSQVRGIDPATRLAGYVTPDNLYNGSPEVLTKPGMSGARRFLTTIWSPAHVTVVDPLGRRTGYDPATGLVVNEIPNASYNGPDGQIETILVTGLNDASGWQLKLTGQATGVYTVQTMYLDPRTLVDAVSRSTYPGKTDVFDVPGPRYPTHLPVVMH